MALLDKTCTDLFATLISFDTTSHKSNLPLIHFVEEYLRKLNIPSHLIKNADSTKASLFASLEPNLQEIPHNAPTLEGGVALSGHTDVVPVEGQKWESDPFTLTFKNGRFYGRGSADMKGFLTCVLASIPHFKSRNLKKPIHLAFSYDEEIGCFGVRPMVSEFGKSLPQPRIVIVGEPTEMKVVDAHKGPARWQIDIKGRAAHSSMSHLGLNSITWAGHLLAELSKIEEDLKNKKQDYRFEPAYSTFQVTKIEGGTASNIIPSSCTLGFEARALDANEIEKIEKRIENFIKTTCTHQMSQIAPEAGINFFRTNYVPPFKTEKNSEAVALALALGSQNETAAVSYATEAGFFQNTGASVVVCGPGRIAEAHTANEWIAETELEKCLQFLKKLGDWCEQ